MLCPADVSALDFLSWVASHTEDAPHDAVRPGTFWSNTGMPQPDGKESAAGLFELDSDQLTLLHVLNHEEVNGIGEVWVGELVEPSGKRMVAVKR